MWQWGAIRTAWARYRVGPSPTPHVFLRAVCCSKVAGEAWRHVTFYHHCVDSFG